jgi:hypothetical protein
MRTLVFTGIVHPERANVTIPESTQELTDLDGKVLGKLVVTILCSQISAELTTVLDDVDVLTLRNSIQPRIEVFVDNFGFNMGCGYEVELVQVLDSKTQQPTVFGIGIDSLQNRYSSKEELIGQFTKVASLCKGMEGVYLARALALLRRAIRSPFDSGLYCYLAVEAVRNIYCLKDGLHPEKEKKKSWALLRNDLDISEDYIKNNIKQYADEIRHGGGIRSFSEKERVKLLESAWEILNRYVVRHGKDDF